MNLLELQEVKPFDSKPSSGQTGESQSFPNDFNMLKIIGGFLAFVDSFCQIRDFFLLKNILSYVN